MRKAMIGLGLAGALALGFGKTNTARADDTPAPSEETQRAADKAEGAANSAGSATYGAEDAADKATNSAGNMAKSAGDATEQSAKESSEKANSRGTRPRAACTSSERASGFGPCSGERPEPRKRPPEMPLKPRRQRVVAARW